MFIVFLLFSNLHWNDFLSLDNTIYFLLFKPTINNQERVQMVQLGVYLQTIFLTKY